MAIAITTPSNQGKLFIVNPHTLARYEDFAASAPVEVIGGAVK